jgi:uncharacterized RDD family membrane protein YckC
VSISAWLPAPADLPAANRLRRLAASAMDEGVLLALAGLLGVFMSAGLIAGLACAAAILQDAPFGGGTSLGRRATGLVLVDTQGQECTVGRGAARNALRLALWGAGCGLPFLLDLGLLLVHPRGQTLADLILGTQVVERAHAVPRALEGRPWRLLGG